MENSNTYRYAGFWIRVAATIIDVVLMLALTVPLMLWMNGIDYYLVPAASQDILPGPMDLLISCVFAVAVIVFWKYRSATPGKMVLSARIVDADTGNAMSLGQCIVRYFAYIVSILPLGMGFLWIAVDRRKQAWHDKIAGTVVILARISHHTVK
jgi:uncharacterized RDD family membrane protein YckC